MEIIVIRGEKIYVIHLLPQASCLNDRIKMFFVVVVIVVWHKQATAWL